MNKTLNPKQFYKELGRLLYAVAMADKKIHPKEVTALKEFVLHQLASVESTSDSSGMNQAFYTSFEFGAYAGQHVNIEEARSSFMKYLDEHILQINPELIDKAIEAIEKVASAFRKVNKEEKEMIASIKKEIMEIADLF